MLQSWFTLDIKFYNDYNNLCQMDLISNWLNEHLIGTGEVKDIFQS